MFRYAPKGSYAFLAVLVGFLVLVSSTQVPVAVAKPSKMSTPTITCGTASKVSIQITSPAGATGAPAGFSLQWMILADFVANGNVWPSSDSGTLCHASFSGNASSSRYNLAAGES